MQPLSFLLRTGMSKNRWEMKGKYSYVFVARRVSVSGFYGTKDPVAASYTYVLQNNMNRMRVCAEHWFGSRVCFNSARKQRIYGVFTNL